MTFILVRHAMKKVTQVISSRYHSAPFDTAQSCRITRNCQIFLGRTSTRSCEDYIKNKVSVVRSSAVACKRAANGISLANRYVVVFVVKKNPVVSFVVCTEARRL